MPEVNRSRESQGRQQSPAHLTSLALRSIGQVYDMNLSAVRVMLQTQARAASALGLPDWSSLFTSMDDRARHVFSTGTEQLVNTAKRANEAAAELQREVGRVVETQATTVAETLKQGFEELGTQATEGLDQLIQTAREQAEEAERVASALGDEMRETMEDASNQTREATRRAGEQRRSTDGGATQPSNGGDRGSGAPGAQGGQPGQPQAGKEPRGGEDKGQRKLAA